MAEVLKSTTKEGDVFNVSEEEYLWYKSMLIFPEDVLLFHGYKLYVNEK